MVTTLDIGPVAPTAEYDGFKWDRKAAPSPYPQGDIPPTAEATSELIPAAYSCINILSTTIGRLEYGVKRKMKGAEPEQDHPLAELMENPNRDYGKLLFWEMMGNALHTHGNALAFIERRNGFPVRLHPADGEPTEERPDGWWYHLRIGGDRRLGWAGFNTGGMSGLGGLGSVPIHQSDVLHLRGPGLDWETNWSPSPVLFAGRHALKTWMQAQIRADSAMRHGAHHSHHVESDKEIPQKALKPFAEWYEENYAGFINAGRPPLLPPGFRIVQTGLSPSDIQLIELLKFTITDIARTWQIPLFLLQHFEQSTGGWANSNLAEQWTNFVRFSLKGHIERYTDEINRKLLPARMRKTHASFIDVEPLITGDMEMTAKIVETLVAKAAVWTPEEGREYTGKPRKPKAGEKLRQPTGAPMQDPGGSGGPQRNRPRDAD